MQVHTHNCSIKKVEITESKIWSESPARIRIPITQSRDANILIVVSKSILERDIAQKEQIQEQNTQQEFCLSEVFFLNQSNMCHARHAIENFGKYTLDLSKMGLNIISSLRLLNTHYLRKLDLSRNYLHDMNFDLDFDRLPLLEDLDLSHNIIAGDLPCMKNSQLSRLNLSHNILDTIPEDLPNSLLVLNISYNLISKVDSHLPSSLRILNLSKNCIQEIPGTLLDSLEKLEDLSLSANYLTKIYFPQTKHSLSTLDISDNPQLTEKDITIGNKDITIYL